MLFMGEEYGEPAPFPFFVDHGDTELLEATCGSAGATSSPAASGPRTSPTRPTRETYVGAVLDPTQAAASPHREVLAAYTELIALRRRHPVLHLPHTTRAVEHHVERVDDAMIVTRSDGAARSVLAVNFGPEAVTVPVAEGSAVVFDSRDQRWGGVGQGVALGERTPDARRHHGRPARDTRRLTLSS